MTNTKGSRRRGRGQAYRSPRSPGKGVKESSGGSAVRRQLSKLPTAVFALLIACAGAFVGAGATYWQTRSTFAHEDATRAREELRSACIENLKVQGGIVYMLDSAHQDLALLKDVKKFQKDLEPVNKIGREGQASTLYLTAPESVQSEVTKFVEATDQAVRQLLRLGAVAAIPKLPIDPDEDAAAQVAIEEARTRLRGVAAACRTQLSPDRGG